MKILLIISTVFALVVCQAATLRAKRGNRNQSENLEMLDYKRLKTNRRLEIVDTIVSRTKELAEDISSVAHDLKELFEQVGLPNAAKLASDFKEALETFADKITSSKLNKSHKTLSASRNGSRMNLKHGN